MMMMWKKSYCFNEVKIRICGDQCLRVSKKYLRTEKSFMCEESTKKEVKSIDLTSKKNERDIVV